MTCIPILNLVQYLVAEGIDTENAVRYVEPLAIDILISDSSSKILCQCGGPRYSNIVVTPTQTPME